MAAEIAKEQSLFEAALQIANAGEREIFLDQSCAGDFELRNRISNLLAAHEKSDRLFSPGVSDFVTRSGDFLTAAGLVDGEPLGGEKIGARVGRYKILRLLGEGGCGVVYLAEQAEPVRRQVALKVIKFGMDTRSVIARFEAERQALALMDHPNIAKVLDAGATETGRPFFVMELVHGVRITNFCDENHLDARQRLDLFIQVCHAIQHAHQKGIIHRDIKPSNILVALHDGVPMPKVIDFGIAKATEGKLSDNTAFTTYGQFIGTPAYMSPEQAELSGLDVDTRSDIYSLGVLLYELLTGRTPFDQKELINSSFDEMRRTLREDEPQRPSTMLTSLANADLTATAHRRHVEPPKLIKSLKGDLDWIVMKTLEKDRERRYGTANGLAMDIQRYLNFEPIVARPPSQFYRLKKLIRRNKVVFASGTIVVLTLIVGASVSTWLFLREREALKVQARLHQEAEQARIESEQARASETQLRKKAEAREKVTEAGVLASHHKMKEADEPLEQVPAELFSPSLEATTVFRDLGIWNTLQGNWKQAADRFTVLVQVNQVDKTDQTDAATFDLLLAEPLLIEAGDIAGYERIRRMELIRLAGTSNLVAVEQLLKTSLLASADASTMKMLEPLAKLLADSLASSDPKINDASFNAAWRAIALALFEYRRGNFTDVVDRLKQCSTYPNQAPSCAAISHVLLGMTWMHLGKTHEADAELALGRNLVENYFNKRLELSDDKSGKIQGWLTARVLLHEVEAASARQP
jgi:eukaryotic-like serine/threonine-protein kinase